MSFDALLVVSFGGPEGMADVMPFLENVLRGRNVPAERMRAVAKHYELFGGVSPINDQNRKLIAALREELAANGPALPIYWGNRNWHPLLADTLKNMVADGIENALAFVTSAYSSYSSCRQYLENISEARNHVGSSAPKIAKLRAFYNHPLFVAANVDRLQAALSTIPEPRRASAQIAFTAHSIPQSMADNCQYESQLQETGRLVSSAINRESSRLVYQSRSGPPTQPWLGPDILDHLKELKDSGTTDVVIAPIGFVSDHMEVIYDLDTEARQFCDQTGINMVRAATVGTHPLFIRMIRELMLERISQDTPPRFLGTRGDNNDLCFTGCCLPKV
jgi:protoporphyrin/coproporphyrin ferrochelatase